MLQSYVAWGKNGLITVCFLEEKKSPKPKQQPPHKTHNCCTVNYNQNQWLSDLRGVSFYTLAI